MLKGRDTRETQIRPKPKPSRGTEARSLKPETNQSSIMYRYWNEYELCNFGEFQVHRLRRDTSKRGADALPPSCAAAARDPRQRATSGFVKLSLACI